MKILFVINNLQMGGIQHSLIELLKVINNKHQIYLFCANLTGGYVDHIPDNVIVLPENKYASAAEKSIKDCKSFIQKFERILLQAFCKIGLKRLAAKLYVILSGNIQGEYDLAISYSQPVDYKTFSCMSNELVLFSVKAKKKATFLHCDYKHYGGNNPYNANLYSKFDYIVSVSESVKKRFLEVLPNLHDKVVVVRNNCDCNEVNRLASEQSIVYEKNKVIFVSISRLTSEKGYLRCIPLFKKLLDNGYRFEWHIIGGGVLFDTIRSEIYSFGLENNIFLEGQQNNPYRFLKNANYLFMPSFHEAAPLVFDEATAMQLPVLTTNTTSAKELIERYKHGIVCDNDEESIYNMLKLSLDSEYNFEFVDSDKYFGLADIQFQELCNMCLK